MAKQTCFTMAAFVMLCLLGVYSPVGSEVMRIVALNSYNAPPYEEALEGFRQYLQQQGMQVEVDIHPLEGNATGAATALREIKNSKPRLILTLGSLATRSALKDTAEMPLVACLALRGAEIREAPNSTGVVLEFPVETQFQWLRRFLPDVRSVGVLYNPEENQDRVNEADRIARQMGLALVPHAVRTPKEIPVALDSVAKRVDVLWGLVDSVVLTPQTAKRILLFSFRNRIPFIGVSAAWVKAGALYALDWDYTDLGMQCAQQAVKILHGARANSMPPVTPRKILYVLNHRTAHHMKVEFPAELSRGARQVFQ